MAINDGELPRDSGAVYHGPKEDTPLFISDSVGSAQYFTPGTDMTPLFHRHPTAFIGSQEPLEDKLEHTQRCFNCGTPTHTLSSCPVPINHPLVSLSRQYYDFFVRSTRPPPLFDLHDLQSAHEHRTLRLRWLDEFTPGQIRGDALRHALGLEDGDPGERVEWLANISEWGYPRGWTGEDDPTALARAKILEDRADSDSESEDEDNFIIFGDGETELVVLHSETATQPALPTSTEVSPTNDQQSQEGQPPDHVRRWASYPSTFFSSSFLTIYSGALLSAVPLASLRPSGWRLPGGLTEDDLAEWKQRMDAVAGPDGRTFNQNRQALWDQIASSMNPPQPTSFLPPPPSPPMHPPPLPSSHPPPLPPPPPSDIPPPIPDVPKPPWSDSAEGVKSDMDLSDSD
jgi:zinc finger CCHC domain-containing protein 8